MRFRILAITATGFTLAALGLAPPASAGSIEDEIWSIMANANAELAFQGAGYRLEVVEYLTAQDEAGQTVFFEDRGNKQLDNHFVAGDPRRTWSGPVGPGDDITWASDIVQGDAGPGLGATQTAIMNAMATWEGVKCSHLPLNSLAIPGNLGVLELIIFGQGSPPVADVTHAGFGSPIDLLLPPPIIAATFTFVFGDGLGNPSDIDNNGKFDTAFKEIYYTNNFPWGIGTDIDVETVALHEVGHALSQEHFGKAFRTDKNGKLHFAPRALMNAGYSGINQQVKGSDNAGHCSIWASWPNN